MNLRESGSILCAAVWLACAGTSVAAEDAIGAAPPPIIDMHLHAHLLEDYGGGGTVCTSDEPIEFPGVDPRKPITIEQVMTCAHPLQSSRSDVALMNESLALLAKYNIWAVTSGSLEVVGKWRAASPARIIPAISFLNENRTPQDLEQLFAAGQFSVFAEIGAQYRGQTLDDPAFEPYFALAERLDIPVGVHLGEGPPGGPHVPGYPTYRARFGNALQLEEVLARHPQLRLYVMHFGSPLVEETIALLYSHPQVFVDVAQNDWGFPRAHFYDQLKRLVDAGFAKRIMWGSDQMVWPHTIEVAIDTIEQAPFLSAQQKRDIFYNNAARFLRLSPSQIADQQRGRSQASP